MLNRIYVPLNNSHETNLVDLLSFKRYGNRRGVAGDLRRLEIVGHRGLGQEQYFIHSLQELRCEQLDNRLAAIIRLHNVFGFFPSR
jgi:hypothetical protein